MTAVEADEARAEFLDAAFTGRLLEPVPDPPAVDEESLVEAEASSCCGDPLVAAANLCGCRGA